VEVRRDGRTMGTMSEPTTDDARVRAIERPHPNLLYYYVVVALLTLVGAPFVFLPLYFRYHTLRFRFDEEGIGASWGILFRREIYLTYKRIQDIHVRRNVVERWLGIGTIEVQTAAGSASAELELAGLAEYELVRDYFYRHMRGHEHHEAKAESSEAAAEGDDVARLLGEIRDELAATRRALEERG